MDDPKNTAPNDSVPMRALLAGARRKEPPFSS